MKKLPPNGHLLLLNGQINARHETNKKMEEGKSSFLGLIRLDMLSVTVLYLANRVTDLMHDPLHSGECLDW